MSHLSACAVRDGQIGGLIWRFATRFSVFLAVAALPIAVGAEDLTEQVRAHLEAGEFGPARDLAAGVDDVGLRDRLLRGVAAAQANVGARRASVDTASYIDGDRARSRALGEIGSGPVAGFGEMGGGPVADFEPLIELITSTIAPETWDEVGGPGAVDGFEGGVFVDTGGMLRKILIESGSASLAAIRNKAASSTGNTDVRRISPLRKVSLRRLEKQAEMLRALGRDPDDVMQSLAGIYQVKYVLFYPEQGDVVLAGPAGDWRVNDEGRKINVETGRPVLNLDDLVVCLRNALVEDGKFGCTINPRKENLAATQKFLATTKLKGAAWREKIQETLGTQDIEVFGVDPRTRLARVMVEADYRMKLVGMGLEDGTAGVNSYLDSVELDADGKPPATDVIRWWFALNYEAVHATEARNAFQLKGPGVKVLSENELLTERGERVHTGKSDAPTREFAHSFTKHFDRLAEKYPIYAELRNIFDLALVAAVIKSEDMPGQIGWSLSHFGPPRNDGTLAYEVELGAAAKHVDTVMNHRIIRARRATHNVVGVSGGVSVDTNQLVKKGAIRVDRYGLMKADHSASKPKNLPRDAWWWD